MVGIKEGTWDEYRVMYEVLSHYVAHLKLIFCLSELRGRNGHSGHTWGTRMTDEPLGVS